MRCRARLSLDGLVSAMLLLECRVVHEVTVTDPKDVLDGLTKVDACDVLVSLPYHAAAGQWHDHHLSEAIRLEEAWALGFRLQGECLPDVPSTARILWTHLNTMHRVSAMLEPWVQAADALEQQGFSPHALAHPDAAMLLGLLLEAEAEAPGEPAPPLTARFADLVQLGRRHPPEQVLEHAACRAARHRLQTAARAYEDAIRQCSTLSGTVLMTDLRPLNAVPPGVAARDFLFFPQARTQLRLAWEPDGHNVRISVRHSPFQQPPAPAVGELMPACGGYGHRRAGQCVVYAPLVPETIAGLLARLTAGS
ncbi:hypothetical protein DGI_3229 [Megalodesulfovibrio gigas DSM 1382 = ATCC 19364]|uniref:Exopolyphosphatase n=2 Tax=Megalodesulfovibrio gigas TaxID=879 RepID=T2GF65_MEGG1|nr:hypothetical protein DGI_3229 [Megalodesulfovibrio gigas DSM 1382 = ATCC 19364]